MEYLEVQFPRVTRKNANMFNSECLGISDKAEHRQLLTTLSYSIAVWE